MKLELEVPKEITEVGQCLEGLLVATGEALKDGWQTGQDLPIILTSAFTGLLAAIEGCQKIPAEAKEAPFKFVQGLINPVLNGAEKMFESLKK